MQTHFFIIILFLGLAAAKTNESDFLSNLSVSMKRNPMKFKSAIFQRKRS